MTMCILRRPVGTKVLYWLGPLTLFDSFGHLIEDAQAPWTLDGVLTIIDDARAVLKNAGECP